MTSRYENIAASILVLTQTQTLPVPLPLQQENLDLSIGWVDLIIIRIIIIIIISIITNAPRFSGAKNSESKGKCRNCKNEGFCFSIFFVHWFIKHVSLVGHFQNEAVIRKELVCLFVCLFD